MFHSLWEISSVSMLVGVGVVGVSFAQISRIFLLRRHRRRCYNHCHMEAPFGKGWLGRKTSGKYHITHWREDRAWVECPWRRQSMPTLWYEKRMCGIS